MYHVNRSITRDLLPFILDQSPYRSSARSVNIFYPAFLSGRGEIAGAVAEGEFLFAQVGVRDFDSYFAIGVVAFFVG